MIPISNSRTVVACGATDEEDCDGSLATGSRAGAAERAGRHRRLHGTSMSPTRHVAANLAIAATFISCSPPTTSPATSRCRSAWPVKKDPPLIVALNALRLLRTDAWATGR
jgi:hypothetical protein